MSPLSIKRTNFVIITIKKIYDFSFKIDSVVLQDKAGLLMSVSMQAKKPLISAIFIGEERHQ
jgi:hypothetical protein